VVCIVLLCNSRFYIQLIASRLNPVQKCSATLWGRFSPGRQARVARVFPSNARRWFYVDSSSAARTIVRGSHPFSGSDPCPFARARRTRDPVSRGKNEADPRVGRWLPLLLLLFFFCWQTARQLVFCLSIFISAVTSVLLLLVPVMCIRMRVPVYIRVPV